MPAAWPTIANPVTGKALTRPRPGWNFPRRGGTCAVWAGQAYVETRLLASFYCDDNHLTTHGLLTLGPLFEPMLMAKTAANSALELK
jgi:hypothetical protein